MKRTLALGALASLCCCHDQPDVVDASAKRAALAPAPQPASLLLGSPLGITSKRDAGIRVKIAGFQPNAPYSWPLPRPRFEDLVSQIVATLNVATNGESPLRAMSVGLDVIIIDEMDIPTGELLDGVAVGTPTPVALLEVSTYHGWYAIEFSVDSAAVHAPDAELAEDVLTAKGAGELDRTVFTYTLPDSTLELLNVERNSVRSLAPDHLGLSQGDEIDALNLHMGLYHTNLTEYGAVLTRPVPPNPTVYFTLRPQFLAVSGVTNAVTEQWGNGQAADAGTIYKTRWDVPTRRWMTPSVYRTWQQLGMETPIPEIDGLAVDTKITATEADDQILFSLADTSARPVPAEWQVMMKAADPAVASRAPRRVVVRVPNGYGSLGAQLKAGRGLGDFCTGDPWNKAKVEKIDFEHEVLPDDFFIARRLANPDAGDVDPTLAVSGFRQYVNERPQMTGCLSWPRPSTTTGTVTIEWGVTQNLTVPSPVFTWEHPITMSYNGQPLTVQHDLPSGGYLPPPPASLTSAFALRWKIENGASTWYSPIAALRF